MAKKEIVKLNIAGDCAHLAIEVIESIEILPNRPKINLRAEQPKDAQASLSRSALSFTTGFA